MLAYGNVVSEKKFIAGMRLTPLEQEKDLSLSLSLSLCKIMKSVKRLFRMGNRCGCIQWVSILFKLWFNVLPALKGQNIVCESTKIFYSCLF